MVSFSTNLIQLLKTAVQFSLNFEQKLPSVVNSDITTFNQWQAQNVSTNCEGKFRGAESFYVVSLIKSSNITLKVKSTVATFTWESSIQSIISQNVFRSILVLFNFWSQQCSSESAFHHSAIAAISADIAFVHHYWLLKGNL